MSFEVIPSSNERLRSQYGEHAMPIRKKLNAPVRRASDCKIEAFEGNEYLDAFSGVTVPAAAYRREREQLERAVSALEPAVEVNA